MELYLIRHGDAIPRSAAGVRNDAERTLTDEGKEEMRKVARGLAKVAAPPEIILASPLVRARQTAEIVREAFDLPGEVVREEERLGSGASPRTIVELLDSLDHERVVLVGHEPDFSRFISSVVCGQTHGRIAMKKGGVARISFDGDNSELLWLLPQKITKALGQ